MRGDFAVFQRGFVLFILLRLPIECTGKRRESVEKASRKRPTHMSERW